MTGWHLFGTPCLQSKFACQAAPLKSRVELLLGIKKHEMHYCAQLMVRNARWGSCLT